MFHLFENSQDCCPLEHDPPKIATKEQNLISAIALATKAVWNNRVKREIHTQPITGLSVLCSHTVFRYSPVLLVSKKHNTPRERKDSKNAEMKSHPRMEVRSGYFFLCAEQLRAGLSHLGWWGAIAGLPSAIFCLFAVLRAGEQTIQPPARVFRGWQQDLGFCPRAEDLIIFIHREIIENNLFTIVIMLYWNYTLKCLQASLPEHIMSEHTDEDR